jgi:anti-sigma factor RsiW
MTMTIDAEVSCKQAHDLLFSYLEGELGQKTVTSLEAHFKLCPPCDEFLASYRKTPGLCRQALDAEVPAEVTQRLQNFLRSKIKVG